MKICLIRHSIAESTAASDAQRRLTDAGKRRSAKLAETLSSFGLIPDLMFVSPYDRAQATAQILSNSFKGIDSINTKTCTANEMQPGEELLESLLPLVNANSESNLLFFIGHQPQIGELASTLVGSARPIFNVSPASAIILELSSFRRGAAKLLAVIQGDLLDGQVA